MYDSDGCCWPDIATPQVVTPVGAVSAALGFTVAGSPFVAANLSLGGIDVEIRTAPNGGGTAQYGLLGGLLGLISSIVPIGALSGLLGGQTYYLRIRYRATDGTASDWSADVQITT